MDPLTGLPTVIAALEALTARVADLETWRAAHEVAMVARQAQVNKLKEETERMAWAVRAGRKDIL